MPSEIIPIVELNKNLLENLKGKFASSVRFVRGNDTILMS